MDMLFCGREKRITISTLPQNREKGKVIGGTKGNKVLEYISGAPAKEQVIERIPNVFDYDELTKYGYGVSEFMASLDSML